MRIKYKLKMPPMPPIGILLTDIFNFLDTLEVEYHKPYKRFNQIVIKVPRGQASYTLT